MISFKVIRLHYKMWLIIFALGIICIVSFLFINNFSKAQTETSVAVPIVMYHSLLKSKSGNYIVHPETLENDLKYIQSKGYATITMTDLIDYVYNDGELPEKPIIITFDDGY